jgi:Protein tyrosine and serine/threonine kinase
MNIQDELTRACENGDMSAAQVAFNKGAQANRADSKGKLPLGAAIYGLNPNIVNDMIRRMGGISPMAWGECEQHNLKHYNEIWPLPKQPLRTVDDWNNWINNCSSDHVLSLIIDGPATGEAYQKIVRDLQNAAVLIKAKITESTGIKPQVIPEKGQSIQDELIRACENGDMSAVQAAFNKGAQAHLADNQGRLPIGAAIYGMNLIIVEDLIKKHRSGISSLKWEDYVRHNLEHYQELYTFPDKPLGAASNWEKFIQNCNNRYILDLIVGGSGTGEAFQKLVKKLEDDKALIRRKIMLWTATDMSKVIISDPKKRQQLQDELVKACEVGDEQTALLALSKGAEADLPDSQGKLPLGAAVYGMNFSLLAYVIKIQGGTSSLTWKECEDHNLKYYHEVSSLPDTKPRNKNELTDMLTKVNNNDILGEIIKTPKEKIYYKVLELLISRTLIQSIISQSEKPYPQREKGTEGEAVIKYKAQEEYKRKLNEQKTRQKSGSLQEDLVRACENGNETEVQTLLNKGANPALSDSNGKNPFAAAVYCMNPRVIDLLLEHQKGIAPIDWQACKQHNLSHYKSVFPFPNSIPGFLDNWLPYLESCQDLFILLKLGFLTSKDNIAWAISDLINYQNYISNKIELVSGLQVMPMEKIQANLATIKIDDNNNNPGVTPVPGPLATHPDSLPSPKAKEITQPLGQINLSFSIPYSTLGFGKKLGQGGFGIVFKGTWQHTEVAIKQLHMMDKQSADMLTEFHQETHLMIQLNHPNVIRLYGACIDQDPYCLVMEYMPKGSLYDVLHSALPLTQELRERIAMDIACGLAYLHDKNILHRDLKSLNVLLDDHLRAKLADFGLAKVKLGSTTSSYHAVGTTRWMAPEIMEDQPYTRSADMYSYGVVLWELVARKIPFEGKSEAAIIRQVTQNKRETVDAIPAGCTPKLSHLIRQCWTAEPPKRPSANEAITQLKGGVPSSPATQTVGGSYIGNLDSNQEASTSYKR